MSKKTLAGSISIVMIIMIASRLLSLVSSSVYMSFYGADNLYINIYSYAINIPNIIFTCFGTALSAVVIPIYASYIASDDKQKADKFANNIISISLLFTFFLVLIGIALSTVLPYLTEFDDKVSYPFTVKALMIMMPSMLFYALNFIFQGMLQSIDKYAWAAVVSVPSSLVVITYVFTLGDKFGVTGLLVATLIGLCLQAVILIPPLLKSGYRYRPSFEFKNPDIVTAFKMVPPVLIGVSAYQINMFYNTSMIAHFEGYVSLLTFVQNIVIYLVLAFVNSVTSVLYPKLSQYAALGKNDEFRNTLSEVLGNVWLLLVPISLGFISVRSELLSLILGWGKTNQQSVDAAAGLMLMYSIGIIGIGSKEILDRAFYALKDTKTPAINGFIIMLINIGASQIFIRFLGADGIPLAYSLASLSGLIILLCLLKRKVGAMSKHLPKLLLKCIFAGAVMYIAVIAVKHFTLPYFSGTGIVDRVIRLAIPCTTGVIVYALMLLAVKVPAALDFLSKITRKAK